MKIQSLMKGTVLVVHVCIANVRNGVFYRGPLSMDTYKKKTKMELQRSVRQLKEENAVYLRMNTELREKLTQVRCFKVLLSDCFSFCS